MARVIVIFLCLLISPFSRLVSLFPVLLTTNAIFFQLKSTLCSLEEYCLHFSQHQSSGIEHFPSGEETGTQERMKRHKKALFILCLIVEVAVCKKGKWHISVSCWNRWFIFDKPRNIKYDMFPFHSRCCPWWVQELPEQKTEQCHQNCEGVINLPLCYMVFNDGWLPGGERHW